MVIEIINGKAFKVAVGVCADCCIRGTKDYAGDCLAARLCHGRNSALCFQELTDVDRAAVRSAIEPRKERRL
jgi:hypothetical protein